jgi:hypothetical protein
MGQGDPGGQNSGGVRDIEDAAVAVASHQFRTLVPHPGRAQFSSPASFPASKRQRDGSNSRWRTAVILQNRNRRVDERFKRFGQKRGRNYESVGRA